MPELPDVTVYRDALARHVVGHRVEGVRVASPFVLRTFDPPISEIVGRRVDGASKIGKRLVLELEGQLFVVVHLMVSGRLSLSAKGARAPGRSGLLALDLDHATLWLTEASTKKRASVHVVRGASALSAFDRGGVDPLEASPAELGARLRRERHTLKRALTDPTIVSGIGNAYSDEILHSARLSPIVMTDRLDDADVARLSAACREVLGRFTATLAAEVGDGFPTKVTSKRADMAVHGKHRRPCPACGDPVQRIAYADNETNYCATCQTGGKLLADRALSRLLGRAFPRSLDELEEHLDARRITPASARGPLRLRAGLLRHSTFGAGRSSW